MRKVIVVCSPMYLGLTRVLQRIFSQRVLMISMLNKSKMSFLLPQPSHSPSKKLTNSCSRSWIIFLVPICGGKHIISQRILML